MAETSVKTGSTKLLAFSKTKQSIITNHLTPLFNLFILYIVSNYMYVQYVKITITTLNTKYCIEVIHFFPTTETGPTFLYTSLSLAILGNTTSWSLIINLLSLFGSFAPLPVLSCFRNYVYSICFIIQIPFL